MSIDDRHIYGSGKGMCWDGWASVPVCDGCGVELPGCDGFDEARAAMKEAGWKTAKVRGEWVNYCPECLDGGGA